MAHDPPNLNSLPHPCSTSKTQNTGKSQAISSYLVKSARDRDGGIAVSEKKRLLLFEVQSLTGATWRKLKFPASGEKKEVRIDKSRAFLDTVDATASKS
ncbi:hypothetical protein BM221_000581 [Beauveria bassiana]|uniref:Uncharacterized protein n=1 Tax=Beauveria bassiana TaxID=176275 RepID=A0A2N6P0W1_BEABA|nr:hypothetical protein BM221_000581 [Beauveria bassiana]